MNRAKQIAFYKNQMAAAKQLKEVAIQNQNIAARLESEAKTALEELGVQPEPKKQKLNSTMQIGLLANLTR